jgi:type I restriction enzyme S subunit
VKITSRWPTAPLGDVVEETQYGTSLKANEQSAGVPVLRMNNITYSGALDLADMKHVEMPDEDFEQYSVRRGDLLFNRTNSQELVGKMGVWNRDEQVAFAGYLVRLRLKTDRADPTFIGAWFNTPEMKALLRTRAKPSINMSNINATEVLKFPVVLPPLAEQRRIAEVLDRAEALRAKRRAALAQLDALTHSLFLDLFGKPKENPKGWPLLRLMEICSPKQWPTISTPELTESGFPVFGANGLIGRYTAYNHEDPTVLITCRGATCGTINVSPPQCYVTGNAMALDNPDPKRVTIEYLAAVLRMRGMTDTISGTAQPQITRQNLQHVTLPIPPITLQREFARRVTAVEKLKTAQRASLAELDALFATLQHRAFRGEL